MEIIFGAALMAVLLFAGALILAIFATAITRAAFPKLPRRTVALMASGLFPVMATTLLAIAFLSELGDGLDDIQSISFMTFAAGSFLGVSIAWPCAYQLTCRLFSLRHAS